MAIWTRLVPQGVSGYDGKVLKLQRSLYGLKQAGRTWNVKIDKSLWRLGFTPTSGDSCVYQRTDGQDSYYIAL